MRLYYDLHIHSCLSPCADEDMTPNNVINMAKLKELDLIGLTDHNHIGNCDAFAKVAAEKNILFLPGIEVHTFEDVHVLCFFKTLETLHAFFKALPAAELPVLNERQRFGSQLLVDEHDQVVGDAEEALLFPLPIEIEPLSALTEEYNGLIVPAHVHRPGYGLLSRLGFFPESPSFTVIESNSEDEYLEERYHVLRNSDAHSLGDINEREAYLDVQEPSLDSVFDLLRRPK